MHESTHGEERWLPVVGYEGFYEVSDRGQVRSLDRVVPLGKSTRHHRGRVLRQAVNDHGHPWVGLYREGSAWHAKVHKLVATAFLGPRPEELMIAHWDDNKLNNHLTNLRYATASDNQLDAVRNKRHHLASRTHCLRGHRLESPNLRVSRLPTRECTACFRAREAVRYAKKVHATDLDIQAVSDAQYLRIIEGDTTRWLSRLA